MKKKNRLVIHCCLLTVKLWTLTSKTLEKWNWINYSYAPWRMPATTLCLDDEFGNYTEIHKWLRISITHHLKSHQILISLLGNAIKSHQIFMPLYRNLIFKKKKLFFFFLNCYKWAINLRKLSKKNPFFFKNEKSELTFTCNSKNPDNGGGARWVGQQYFVTLSDDIVNL